MWRVAPKTSAHDLNSAPAEDTTPVSGEHARFGDEAVSGEHRRPSFVSLEGFDEQSEPDIVITRPGMSPLIEPLVVVTPAEALRPSVREPTPVPPAPVDALAKSGRRRRPTVTEIKEAAAQEAPRPPRSRALLIASAAVVVVIVGAATVLASTRVLVPRAAAAPASPPAALEGPAPGTR
jgi:hypothetical protein